MSIFISHTNNLVEYINFDINEIDDLEDLFFFSESIGGEKILYEDGCSRQIIIIDSQFALDIPRKETFEDIISELKSIEDRKIELDPINNFDELFLSYKKDYEKIEDNSCCLFIILMAIIIIVGIMSW